MDVRITWGRVKCFRFPESSLEILIHSFYVETEGAKPFMSAPEDFHFLESLEAFSGGSDGAETFLATGRHGLGGSRGSHEARKRLIWWEGCRKGGWSEKGAAANSTGFGF